MKPLRSRRSENKSHPGFITRTLRLAAALAVTTRAPFLPASILPVVIGALLARQITGRFDAGLLLWTLFGVTAVHLSANVANDYFDYRSGNDAVNKDYIRPFTGGSRTVLDGRISPAGLLAFALAWLGLSFIPAVYIAATVSPWILVPAGIAVLIGWLYSAPPAQLSARGLGEPAVALDFAVLPVFCSYWIQAGEPAWRPVTVSLPLAALISAVLVVNQLPDYQADAAVGKRNWVVRLGKRRGSILYAALVAAWMPLLLPAISTIGTTAGIILCLVFAPVAFAAAVIVIRRNSEPRKLAPACALTAFLHSGVAASICAALIIQRI